MDEVAANLAMCAPVRRLADCEVVLTSSERLARDLRVDAALQMRRSGRRAWAAPEIHSFRSWTLREWASCWPKEQILHPAQELALWLYAIEKSGAADRQLSRMAAARQARQIGSLVQAYRINPEPDSFAGPEEILFFQWYTLAKKAAAERGWLLESGLPEALTILMDVGEWSPPEKVRTIGLVHETPSQTVLLEAMAARGTTIVRDCVVRSCQSTVTLLRPVNRIAQVRMAAERIRDILKPFREQWDREPPRIALIVPELDSSRSTIDAILGEYLAPYTLIPGELRERRPWRYARGFPLADEPLVALALDLVGLEKKRNRLDLISRILLSPLVFSHGTRSEKASFDLRLRRIGYWFSLSRLQELTVEVSDPDEFAGQVNEWLTLYESTWPGHGLPSVWANWIQTVLNAAGWGIGALTSTQAQVVEAWSEALDVFRAMDSQIGEINASQMLVWIREILFARPFQPAVRHLQPVHVLPYGDALGGVYDEIIVLDAVATALPEVSRAAGLISPERMAASDVPGSTPDRALADAEQWRDLLIRMAPKIVVMAPAHDESGGALTPSPVFIGWPDEVSFPESCSDMMTLADCCGAVLEIPEREAAPPVRDLDTEGIHGGVSIFTAMSVSPWVAFMRHRLGLSEFPSVSEGIDARHQGQLMHRVLERFWITTRTRDALLAIPSDQLAHQVRELISIVQAEDRLLSPEVFGEGLAAVERLRMSALILDWLSLEKRRTNPFEVVLAEAKTEACIGGLKVSLRIDRVDRILCDDGSVRYLAIDYKSSARLKESKLDPYDLQDPQLPIYASFTDLRASGIPTIDGVAWARVSEAGCGFVTVAGFCKNVVPVLKGRNQGIQDWAQRIHEWQSMLERQAALFMDGSLDLDRERFCKERFYDDLAPLARLVNEVDTLALNGAPFNAATR